MILCYDYIQVVKDGHLLVVVGIFLLLDTLVLVTWNSINPTHQIRITLPPEVGI